MTYPWMSLSRQIEKEELLAQGNFGLTSWEAEQVAAWLRELQEWRSGKMEKRLKPHDELISRNEALEVIDSQSKQLTEIINSVKAHQRDDYFDGYYRGLREGLLIAGSNLLSLKYVYKKSENKK